MRNDDGDNLKLLLTPVMKSLTSARVENDKPSVLLENEKTCAVLEISNSRLGEDIENRWFGHLLQSLGIDIKMSSVWLDTYIKVLREKLSVFVCLCFALFMFCFIFVCLCFVLLCCFDADEPRLSWLILKKSPNETKTKTKTKTTMKIIMQTIAKMTNQIVNY